MIWFSTNFNAQIDFGKSICRKIAGPFEPFLS